MLAGQRAPVTNDAVALGRKAPVGFGRFVVETIMLICAVFASLTLGVLVSYVLCQGMFRVFRVHSISAAQRRMQAAVVPAIEG